MLLRNQPLPTAPIRISKFADSKRPPPSEDVSCEEDEEANLLESDEEVNDSRNRLSEPFVHNRSSNVDKKVLLNFGQKNPGGHQRSISISHHA